MAKEDFKKIEEKFYAQVHKEQKELESIYDTTMANMLKRAMISKYYDVINKHQANLEVRLNQAENSPMIAIQGSKYDVAFMAFLLLNFDDHFVEMLQNMLLMREAWILMNASINTAYSKECDSAEELEVLKEMLKKNPEELEKLKKELTND